MASLLAVGDLEQEQARQALLMPMFESVRAPIMAVDSRRHRCQARVRRDDLHAYTVVSRQCKRIFLRCPSIAPCAWVCHTIPGTVAAMGPGGILSFAGRRLLLYSGASTAHLRHSGHYQGEKYGTFTPRHS